jgi:hypothetical protein
MEGVIGEASTVMAVPPLSRVIEGRHSFPEPHGTYVKLAVASLSILAGRPSIKKHHDANEHR